MHTLVFVTNNKHKLEEIQKLAGADFTILNLKDIGCFDEIPEDGDTLEENSLAKAMYVYQRFNVDCFADDTGLEIDALGGRPGVMSARYAGPECIADHNINKILNELASRPDRRARFRTVISLIINGYKHFFEGIVNGRIIEERRGNAGFGYDPVFIPDGYDLTFAEMETNLKNQISHRGIATSKLIRFLKQL